MIKNITQIIDDFFSGNKTQKINQILFFILSVTIIVFASSSIFRLFSELLTPGPNTVGEAGKVYFANRFQNGLSIFETGLKSPYYPALHGALLHISVGFLGFLFELKISDLYFVGRAISLFCFSGSVIILYYLLKKLEISKTIIIFSLLIFLMPYNLHIHTVSYRPETWILFLYALVLVIRIFYSEQYYGKCLLIALPVLMFFIKPTSISIFPAIAFSFLITKNYVFFWKYLFYGVLFFISTITLVNWSSDGAFLNAFFNGVNAPFSIKSTLKVFNRPIIWIPLFLPLFIFNSQTRKENMGILQLLFCFWAVELFSSFLFSMRMGANLYYFLNSYYLAVIALAVWCKQIFNIKNNLVQSTLGPLICIVILITFYAGYKILLQEKDVEIKRSLKFYAERPKIAEWINNKKLKCFSDDSGLNVLLRAPCVLYPWQINTFSATGKFPHNFLADKIKRKEYDLIVLTGTRWKHDGIWSLTNKQLSELNKNYKLIFTKSKYKIYKPKKAFRRNEE